MRHHSTKRMYLLNIYAAILKKTFIREPFVEMWTNVK